MINHLCNISLHAVLVRTAVACKKIHGFDAAFSTMLLAGDVAQCARKQVIICAICANCGP